MRLTRKLTLALMLGITLVMAANALLQVRRENALFDIDSRRDQQAVGSVLHTAVEHIWLAAGEGAAQQLIQEASQINPDLTMRWVSLTPRGKGDDAPLASLGELRPVVAGHTLVVRATAPDGDERRITYLPLSIGGEPHGALEISESLQSERGFTRATKLQVAATTLTMLLVCAAIASALGVWFVGRPIRRSARRRGGSAPATSPARSSSGSATRSASSRAR